MMDAPDKQCWRLRWYPFPVSCSGSFSSLVPCRRRRDAWAGSRRAAWRTPSRFGLAGRLVGEQMSGKQRKEKDEVSKDREGEWILIGGRPINVSMADRKEVMLHAEEHVVKGVDEDAYGTTINDRRGNAVTMSNG